MMHVFAEAPRQLLTRERGAALEVVRLRIPPTGPDAVDEWLWVEKVTDHLFHILSIPFFTSVCSAGDVVLGVENPATFELEFVAMDQPRASGHWLCTLRAGVRPEHAADVFDELQAAHGMIEMGGPTFFAVATTWPDTPEAVARVLRFHHAKVLSHAIPTA